MSATDAKIERLAMRPVHERSRRVVFVSRCLLNQNARYLGGASHPGGVPEAVGNFIRDGTGLYQMQAVRACLVEGEGLYIEALRRALERRGPKIAFLEHEPA